MLVLLCDGIILGVLLEVLGPRDVDEDVTEHANGIGISVHHHVGEAYIVVGGEVSGHDAGKHGLLIQLNIVKSLESEAEVSQQAVHAEETDDGEVSQHLVQILGTVLAGNGGRVLVSPHGSELLRDLGPLDQRVQDVEDAVGAPSVGVLLEDLNLLFVVGLTSDS